MSDLVTIRIEFLATPSGPIVQEWKFANEPEAIQGPVDEHALEEDVYGAVRDAGGANTTSLERSSRRGGWGAEGLSTLEIIVSVAANIASSALWDALKAAYRRRTGLHPIATKQELASDPVLKAEASAPGLPAAEASQREVVAKQDKKSKKKSKKKKKAR